MAFVTFLCSHLFCAAAAAAAAAVAFFLSFFLPFLLLASLIVCAALTVSSIKSLTLPVGVR